MQKYFDSLLSPVGAPLVSASVQVNLTGTATPASLFTDAVGSSPKANPVSTDLSGFFEFYAADGRYDLVITAPGYTGLTVSDILLEDPANANAGVFSTLSAAANGAPLTINSTNSNGNKIKLQNAGSDLGFLGADANHVFVASTSGGTQRFYVSNVAGGIGLNTAYAGNGTGITFPAIQANSSDANTLDDYEEGTWTPTQGAGLTVVGAFSSTGTYTKVGRQVTVHGRVSGATSVAVTAAGAVCAGLPFAVAGDPYAVGSMTNNSTNVSVISWVVASTIYAGTAITATSNIYFSLTYNV